MKRLHLISISITSLLAVSLLACSKSEDAAPPAGASILASEVVSYLPASSFGFFTWNTDSAGYKKLKTSPWGQNMSKSLELIKGVEQSGELAKVVPIVESLIQTGLLPKSPSEPDVVHSGIGFLDIDKANKLPSAAIYMAATPGQDLQTKIPTLQKAITDQGLKTEKASIGGVEGFSIELATDAANPFKKLFVAYNKDKLAVSTSSDLAGKLFNGKPDAGIEQIKNSNEFKQAVRGVSSPEESMSFAFFDMNKFISQVASLGLSPAQDPSSELKEIPVESLALSSSMRDSLSYSVAVSLNPKTDDQKKVITSLGNAGSNEIIGRVPSDIMLLLTLDGATIANIKNAALSEIPAEALGPMGEQLKALDSLKGLSIGIRGATGPTPFPEVVLVAQTTQAADLQKIVKSQLDLALASSGMPMPWQEKEVSGAKVTYALTPFGVGAYLTSTDNLVVVASAEKLIGDLVSSSKDSSKTLLAHVSDTTKKMLDSSKPVVVAYSDFNKLAGVLSSAQDSLSMFTGGQGGITPEQLESMKKVGTVVLSLNVDNNLVKLQSTYELPNKG